VKESNQKITVYTQLLIQSHIRLESHRNKIDKDRKKEKEKRKEKLGNSMHASSNIIFLTSKSKLFFLLKQIGLDLIL
jgi:hypothetical protein